MPEGYPSMTPKKRTEKLDAELKDQADEMVKLQGNVAENKEATEELKKSLDDLDTATQKTEKEEG